MIFTASITEDSSPQSKALYDTLVKREGRLPTYVMAAQAYDSVKLLAAAMTQAKTTDGDKVQAALENLGPVKGVIKTYTKPFSAETHEALTVKDFRLVRWVNGKVVSVDDATVKAITPADLKF
jgi:branched-chain amino acid transport system substrate-binding protein